MKSLVKPSYDALIKSIGALLEQGRRNAVVAINSALVRTYWEIGKRIVEHEQAGNTKARYGAGLLEMLSQDLSRNYGRGFSVDNLENMRRFYLLFRNSETVSRKLSWSHYCLIMRLDNTLARDFYAVEASKEGWSVRELERQIHSMLFERIGLSKDSKGVLALSKKGHVVMTASDIVKDPYVLDFLGLEHLPRYTEKDLEERLITNLQQFLLELGKGFMFVERQKRITLDGENFFIDLVFYNRLLQCFVVIELKLGKLAHKDIGQLQMYVNYYDREIKSVEENPSVGILLCADKKDAIVRYTLPENNARIFASKYQLCLPDKRVLENKLKLLLENRNENS